MIVEPVMGRDNDDDNNNDHGGTGLRVIIRIDIGSGKHLISGYAAPPQIAWGDKVEQHITGAR